MINLIKIERKKKKKVLLIYIFFCQIKSLQLHCFLNNRAFLLFLNKNKYSFIKINLINFTFGNCFSRWFDLVSWAGWVEKYSFCCLRDDCFNSSSFIRFQKWTLSLTSKHAFFFSKDTVLKEIVEAYLVYIIIIINPLKIKFKMIKKKVLSLLQWNARICLASLADPN